MNVQVRPGYKLTEVGVIPEDWECKVIQELLEARAITSHLDGNHGELYPRSEEFKDYGIPYIGANDFFNGRVDLDNCKFLAKGRALLFRKGVARSGDILFAHNATVGPVAKLGTDLDFVILSTTATYFRCNEELLHNNYLMQFLKSDFFIAQYVPVMSQSTRNQVPITTQRKLCVIAPPLKEQRLIAVALSDMDALISSLDQLIAKKRDIKQATMQQLLTGQQRLPGFTGEWEMKRLGECLEVSPDYGINAPAVPFSDRLPTYIRITDITDDGRFSTDSPASVDSIDAPNYYLSKGDIVFARTGASVGKSYLYRLSDGPLVFAGFLIRVRVNQLLLYPDFLAAYVSTSSYWRWVQVMSMRSGQPGINGNEFAQLPIPVPPVEEQTAIATIVSDMNNELATLETRRDKARQFKQGMMQELLTGRIRLL